MKLLNSVKYAGNVIVTNMENLAASLASLEVALTFPVMAMLQLAFSVLSLFYINDPIFYPKQANIFDGQSFDFIVVGAGSAGCVVANRLTEVGYWNVLLIEAGDDPNILSIVPGLYPLSYHTPVDWGYYTVNDGYFAQAHKTRNLHQIRGKMLGGSSGLNFMMYVRGNERDYNSWVEQGNEGWDWDNVTFYFKKSERLDSEAILRSESASLHNTKGYLGVTRPYWEEQTQKYFEAFQEDGRDYLEDINGFSFLGYAPTSYTADRYVRQSSATAFLSPVRDRKNLYVLKRTFARKIIIDINKRAVGVEVRLSNGTVISVQADKEVILSAGSINSPQLLMLSGVGPKTHLKDVGIEVKLDSPKVGQNLQDHYIAMVSITGQKNVTSAIENLAFLANLDKSTTTLIVGMAARKTTQAIYPEYQIIGYPVPAASLGPNILCTSTFELEDEICTALVRGGLTKETIIAVNVLLNPASRGQIRLKNSDPEEHPLIYTEAYSNDIDLENHAQYIEDFLSVMKTSYFKNVKSEVLNLNVRQCKDLKFASHEYWKCYVLNTANFIWHPAGTCAMGPEGVVDETLMVRGIEGLRVADASIMPTIVSGNINAPTIMIGEKVSDMIKVYYGVNTQTTVKDNCNNVKKQSRFWRRYQKEHDCGFDRFKIDD